MTAPRLTPRLVERFPSIAAATTVLAGALLFRPFSDLPFLWSRGIRPGAPPYLSRVVEYPVVAGWSLWVVSLVARSATSAFVWWAIAAAALAALATTLLARLGARPLVAWFAGPQLAAYGAHNIDLVAIVPAIGALVAWDAGAYGLAGALAAVGTSAKLFPAVLVVAFVAAGARGFDAVRRMIIGFVLTLAALNVPFAAARFSRWWWTFAFHGRRGPTWGSAWFYLVRWVGGSLARGTVVRLVNVGSFGSLAVAALGIAVFAYRRALPLHDTVALLVLAWIVTSKIYSPQFDLWLVPFLTLCPLRRSHLWRLAVVDVTMFVVDFFPQFEEPLKGHLVETVVFVRLAVLGALAVALIRRAPGPPAPGTRWPAAIGPAVHSA